MLRYVNVHHITGTYGYIGLLQGSPKITYIYYMKIIFIINYKEVKIALN